jgi:hypothetical protein
MPSPISRLREERSEGCEENYVPDPAPSTASWQLSLPAFDFAESANRYLADVQSRFNRRLVLSVGLWCLVHRGGDRTLAGG